MAGVGREARPVAAVLWLGPGPRHPGPPLYPGIRVRERVQWSRGLSVWCWTCKKQVDVKPTSGISNSQQLTCSENEDLWIHEPG